jgi:5-oxoprolinase (ATP-hydrolysing) subunit A
LSGRRIDLSCDLGEALSAEERAIEDAIWPMISAANVACGGHVGDERSMREAIDRCLEHGVTLGAHPSYPDREGFGRRHMEIATEDLVTSLAGQIEALRALGRERGLDVVRVKPHGALYNEAQVDPRLAEAVVAAVRQAIPSAALVSAGGSEVERACASSGLAVVREAFVDRRYLPSGALQPRSAQGSMLLDPEEAAAQALLLAREGRVIACDGTAVAVEFETLCAHSDMPRSVERIGYVRVRLVEAGFSID